MREILHLSDIHYGPHHLPEVARGVLQLVADREPDVVAISGDLTIRAKPHQFRDAARFVAELRERVPATLAVPGNHDVPLYRVWERVLAPYGAYRRHFDRDLEPVFTDDEIHVFGLNTAFNWTLTDGRVTNRQLDRLTSQLAAVPEGVGRVVIGHHQLVPPPRFEKQKVMRRAQRLAEVLAEGRVDAFLSGHVHQSFVTSASAYFPELQWPVRVLVSGTTTSSRGRGCEHGLNTCNYVQLDSGRLRVLQLTWNPQRSVFEETAEYRFPSPTMAGRGEA